LKVTFSAALPRKYEFPLQVLTLDGAIAQLSCQATVLAAFIEANPPSTFFGNVPMGEEAFARIVLKNKRKDPLQFELERVPGFFFDPVVGKLDAEGETPVTVRFVPALETIQLPQPSQSDVASPVQPQQRRKSEQTPKSRKGKKEIPQEEPEPEHGPSVVVDPNFTKRVYRAAPALFVKLGSTVEHQQLALEGSVVLPSVFITGITIGKSSRKTEVIDLSMRSIDFGTVSVGQSRVAILEVRHGLPGTQRITAICDRGSWEIASPECAAEHMQPFTVRVKFTPMVSQKFVGQARIQVVGRPGAFIRLFLSGQGAAPQISLGSERLDFGQVLAGATVTRTLAVKNGADFPLTYTYVVRDEEAGSGQPRFKLDKTSEELSPGEASEVAISFRCNIDVPCVADLVVAAGDESQNRVVPMTACVWACPMFVSGGVEEPRIRTRWDSHLLDEPYFRSSVEVEMVYQGPNEPAPQSPLTIGCASAGEEANGKPAGKGGEWNFEGIQGAGFSFTPAKGSVEQGGAAKVIVQYDAPQAPGASVPVGQFVTCECTLTVKCGDFTRKVPVKVRCLINAEILENVSTRGRPTGATQKKTPTGKRKA
jgi:hypothetical protein